MSNTATNSVHGHEIIGLVHEAALAGHAFTRQTLAAEITRQLGPEPRFHTCASGGMSLDQLLTFLISRGKVVEADGVLTVNTAEVCGHDDHDHD